jgi:hypothetical protein
MRWLLLLAVLACVRETGVMTISEMLIDPRSSALMHAALAFGAADIALSPKRFAAALAVAAVGLLLCPLPCRLSDPGCLSKTNAPWIALHFGAAAVLVVLLLASLRAERRDLFVVAAALASMCPALCLVGVMYGHRASYVAGCACQMMLLVVYVVWMGQ